MQSIEIYLVSDSSLIDFVRYDGVPRLELLTRSIAETLRLWNVAITTFGRVTDADDLVSADGKQDALVPKGSRFTFWFYGHHHCAATWGGEPHRFDPTRQFEPAELQLHFGACRRRTAEMTPNQEGSVGKASTRRVCGYRPN